jgi:SAM-dependent methyltransferase
VSFSAEWLALREPADHAARNAEVTKAVRRHFSGRERVSVLDYGCGAGSNLRGTYQLLPKRQRWGLVDYDPALLAAAREALEAWADMWTHIVDVANDDLATLTLHKGEFVIDVNFAQADLSRGVGHALPQDVDLVTAAAFFDLVSEPWIERFAALLADRRLPFYTVLTYDGRDRFEPADPLDGEVLAAFASDMGRDKGFGPAAGPAATGALVRAFEARGYQVTTADSPWRLDAAGPLARALADGFVAAIGATGRVEPHALARWAERRRSGMWETGHSDLFAAPP